MVRIIWISILLVSCSKGFNYYYGSDASLHSRKSFWFLFMTGFKNDTISLSINKQKLLDNNVVLNSVGEHHAWAQTELKFDNDTLSLDYVGSKSVFKDFHKSKELNVEISYRSKVFRETFDLARGRYFYVSIVHLEGGIITMKVYQHKKMIGV